MALPTPTGFSITTTTCWRFLNETGLAEEIDAMLAELIDDEPARLESVSQTISDRIMKTPLPPEIQAALDDATSQFSSVQRFAVRSSAIGED
ncbi:MAG: PEP/pyruvate-binding domain-containing protein, partial [Actinomycetes bacterium]